jgi:hypothetical protein
MNMGCLSTLWCHHLFHLGFIVSIIIIIIIMFYNFYLFFSFIPSYFILFGNFKFNFSPLGYFWYFFFVRILAITI